MNVIARGASDDHSGKPDRQPPKLGIGGLIAMYLVVVGLTGLNVTLVRIFHNSLTDSGRLDAIESVHLAVLLYVALVPLGAISQDAPLSRVVTALLFWLPVGVLPMWVAADPSSTLRVALLLTTGGLSAAFALTSGVKQHGLAAFSIGACLGVLTLSLTLGSISPDFEKSLKDLGEASGLKSIEWALVLVAVAAVLLAGLLEALRQPFPSAPAVSLSIAGDRHPLAPIILPIRLVTVILAYLAYAILCLLFLLFQMGICSGKVMADVMFNLKMLRLMAGFWLLIAGGFSLSYFGLLHEVDSALVEYVLTSPPESWLSWVALAWITGWLVLLASVWLLSSWLMGTEGWTDVVARSLSYLGASLLLASLTVILLGQVLEGWSLRGFHVSWPALIGPVTLVLVVPLLTGVVATLVVEQDKNGSQLVMELSRVTLLVSSVGAALLIFFLSMNR